MDTLVWRCFEQLFPLISGKWIQNLGLLLIWANLTPSQIIFSTPTQMPMGEPGRFPTLSSSVEACENERWCQLPFICLPVQVLKNLGGFIAISHLVAISNLGVCVRGVFFFFFSGERRVFFEGGVGSQPWKWKPKATKISKLRRKQKKKYEKQIEDWGAFYKSFSAVPLAELHAAFVFFWISYKNHGETGETLGVFLCFTCFFCVDEMSRRIPEAEFEESRCMQCRGPHVTWNELALYVFQPFFAAMVRRVVLSRRVHSGKLTWQWKITIFNKEYIFNWSIFHCHISLPEGTLFDMSYATEAFGSRRFRWLEGHCFLTFFQPWKCWECQHPHQYASICIQFLLSPMGNSI